MQESGGRGRSVIRDIREFGARLGEEFPVEAVSLSTIGGMAGDILNLGVGHLLLLWFWE